MRTPDSHAIKRSTAGLLAAVLLLIAVIATLRLCRQARVPTTPDSGKTGQSHPDHTDHAIDDIGFGGVAGIVTSQLGVAQPGAWIAVRGSVRRVAESNASGEFSIRDLPPGRYVVAAGTPDGATAATACDVHSSVLESVNLRIGLTVGAVAFGGRVHDILGGPVPDAEVWIGGGESEAEIVVARTDRSGHFATRAPVGERELRVRASGYAESMDSINISDSLEVDIIVQPASTIRGSVVRGGLPVVGAFVRAARREHSRDDFSATTGLDGRFTIRDLPPGDFVVESRTATDIGTVSAIILPPAGAREVFLQMATGCSVSGSVRSSTGERIPNVDIAVDVENHLAQEVKAGADGRFRVASISPGPATLRACAQGHQCARADVLPAAAGASLEVELVLERAAQFRIRVLDEKGRPAGGARARVGTFGGCTTSPSGECVVDHASSRKEKLVVEHPSAGFYEGQVEVGSRAIEVVRLAYGATIRGTVRWEDGSAATGVHVFSFDRIARSGVDGRYELTNVAPGPVNVRAALSIELGDRRMTQMYGRDPGDKELGSVGLGDVRENIDVTVARNTGRLAGFVLRADGSPASYARVGFFRDDSSNAWAAGNAGGADFGAMTYAASDGAFTIEKVGRGAYVVWADVEGETAGRVRGVAAGEENVMVRLPDGATIEGSAVDHLGNAVREVVVRVDTPAIRATSDNGRFTLEGVSSGKHRIVVESYADVGASRSGKRLLGEVETELFEGKRKALTVVLRESVGVTGRLVRWPDLTPQGGVLLFGFNGSAQRSAITLEDGRFHLEGLLPGAISLLTSDAVGQQERWERQVADGIEVNVGDLAFAANNKGLLGFPYSVDGQRAIVARSTDSRVMHLLGLEQGDEIVSVGGHTVATLSTGSLEAVIEGLMPDVPVVVNKVNAQGSKVIRTPPRQKSKP